MHARCEWEAAHLDLLSAAMGAEAVLHIAKELLYEVLCIRREADLRDIGNAKNHSPMRNTVSIDQGTCGPLSRPQALRIFSLKAAVQLPLAWGARTTMPHL